MLYFNIRAWAISKNCDLSVRVSVENGFGKPLFAVSAKSIKQKSEGTTPSLLFGILF